MLYIHNIKKFPVSVLMGVSYRHTSKKKEKRSGIRSHTNTPLESDGPMKSESAQVMLLHLFTFKCYDNI